MPLAWGPPLDSSRGAWVVDGAVLDWLVLDWLVPESVVAAFAGNAALARAPPPIAAARARLAIADFRVVFMVGLLLGRPSAGGE